MIDNKSIAHELHCKGYKVIPILPCSKKPSISNWQNYEATVDDINAFWSRDLGIGILHTNTRCIDIDVDDPDLAQEILQEVLRRFPGGIYKAGKYPRSAFIFAFRPEPPAILQNTQRYVLHNTQRYERDGIKACVEIRTAGQSVVYGIHPVTQEPYVWPIGDLYDRHISDLPMPSIRDLVEFRGWAQDKLRAWGDARIKNWAAKEIKPPIIDPGSFALSSDAPPAETELHAALRAVDPNMQYSDWVRVLMGLHDYYSGSQRGLQVAKEWSSPYPNYNPAEVEAKWRSFKSDSGGVSYKTIFEYAKQAGVDLRSISSTVRNCRTVQGATDAAQQEVAPGAPIYFINNKPALFPTPLRHINEALMPPREWVYSNHYIKKYISATASEGGIGKSSLTMTEALAIATGRPLLGVDVRRPCNVWIANLEDPLEEMEMRVKATMNHYDLVHEDLAGKLFLDAEETAEIVLARQKKGEVEFNEIVLKYMIEKVREREIGVVIMDPFVSTHLINENDNSGIQGLMRMFRRLARETGAAVHIVHHVRKGNGSRADGDSVRGGSSFQGAVRALRVINRLTNEELRELGVLEKEIPDLKQRLFHVGTKKQNMSLSGDDMIIEMVNVELCNGERVGVATRYNPPGKKDPFEGVTATMAREVQNIIERKGEDGVLFGSHIKSKDWVGELVADVTNIDMSQEGERDRVKYIVKKWIDNNVLEEFERKMMNGRMKTFVRVKTWVQDYFTDVHKS